MDDVPPPPYTETDLHSRSDGRSPTATQHPHQNSRHDDAVSRVSSSSNGGDVIYTPPLTPRSHHASFSESQEHVAQSAAAAYFEARPAPAIVPAQQVVHSITVQADSTPRDFPYTTDWAGRDVAPQDWQTFINFIIPHHSAVSNSVVIERKARAEGLDEDAKSGSEQSHASAQLEQIRTPIDTQTWQHISDMITEWNDGFFRPRGIAIRLNPADDGQRMPGSWDQSFDAGPGAENGADARNVANAGSNSRGFNWGGIRVDENGISIGNTVVADRNGVRIGSLNIPVGGYGPAGHGIPGHPFGNYGPGFHYGGPGQYDGHYAAHGDPHDHHHDHREFGGHRHGGRGRDRFRNDDSRRCHRSRSSSASSSSSSSSESSIGSLPDYDHLRDSQLPVFKNRVQAWLSQPDRIITKAEVKEFKSEIKIAKSQGRFDFEKFDKQALKQEVKQLAQNFRQLKKSQRQGRKAHRKERKARRKAEKQERKAHHREMRHARHDLKKAQKEFARDFVKGFGGPRRGGMAPFPQPGTHPALPPIPAFFNRGGFHQWGRGFGGPRGRGWNVDHHGFRGGLFPGARNAPGSWPQEEANHTASQAKYKAAEQLEKETEKREKALEDARQEQLEEKSRGNRDGNRGPSQTALKIEVLEKEVDALRQSLERLRIEADAEYAKELEDHDRNVG